MYSSSKSSTLSARSTINDTEVIRMTASIAETGDPNYMIRVVDVLTYGDNENECKNDMVTFLNEFRSAMKDRVALERARKAAEEAETPAEGEGGEGGEGEGTDTEPTAEDTTETGEG